MIDALLASYGDRQNDEDKGKIMGKLIFLDIDGTLVDFTGRIPDSTIDALNRARINGHKIFICSGRIRKEFYSFLDSYTLDGFVAGSGAHVNYQGRDLYRHHLDQTKIAELVKIFEEYEIGYKLQASSGSYTTKTGKEKLFKAFGKIPGRTKEWLDSIMSEVYVKEDFTHLHDVEKILYLDAPFQVDEMRGKIDASYYTVIMASIERPNPYSGEITKSGINKSSGIKRVLTHLHMSRNDCIAIGDGQNDLDMLNYAGIGVAMGNASDDVKESADMVTAAVTDDGIYKAFGQLGLL